ncbi:MAG: hypothetical protein HY287_11075 [Planctomycetes bacterium]|nr:hypothetical protein [Planctomycetota bacterium]MBI3834860.1 hypothetical protein [Planctomycetota bacterium]
MRFVFHQELIEQVVGVAARRDSLRECELHERVDRLYAIGDSELRNRSFREAYAKCFMAWGLGGSLQNVLREFSESPKIEQCVIVPAERSKTHRVDLLTKGEDERSRRTLFVQLSPEAVLDPTSILSWLRRELCHVADMLDETFGYVPDAIDGSPWERTLRHERYMLLWRISIAGRLNRSGVADEAELIQLRRAFGRAFMLRGMTPPSVAFDRITNAEALTHGDLLNWALHPEALLHENEDTEGASNQRLGGLCPLCGFPTFDWFDFDGAESSASAVSIQGEHGTWSSAKGACRQCAETYAFRVDRSRGVPNCDRMGGEDASEKSETCVG